METVGRNNVVAAGRNVQLDGRIEGNDNYIEISDALHPSVLDIRLRGNRNRIVIESAFQVKLLHIMCGSHVPAHETRVEIKSGFSIEPRGNIWLLTSGGKLSIGPNCMASSDVTIRCGESPHLIFDRETGQYLDGGADVRIGEHVWLGERSYLTKRAGVGKGSIVAACAVVTRAFEEENVVLAGNPAKITRRNVEWMRNYSLLEKGHPYADSYVAFNAKFERG